MKFNFYKYNTLKVASCFIALSSLAFSCSDSAGGAGAGDDVDMCTGLAFPSSTDPVTPPRGAAYGREAIEPGAPKRPRNTERLVSGDSCMSYMSVESESASATDGMVMTPEKNPYLSRSISSASTVAGPNPLELSPFSSGGSCASHGRNVSMDAIREELGITRSSDHVARCLSYDTSETEQIKFKVNIDNNYSQVSYDYSNGLYSDAFFLTLKTLYYTLTSDVWAHMANESRKFNYDFYKTVFNDNGIMSGFIYITDYDPSPTELSDLITRSNNLLPILKGEPLFEVTFKKVEKLIARAISKQISTSKND